jgi:hypothetical protein
MNIDEIHEEIEDVALDINSISELIITRTDHENTFCRISFMLGETYARLSAICNKLKIE